MGFKLQMGFRIFILCLRQLFSNLKIAFQLSWAWVAILIIFGIVTGTSFSRIPLNNIFSNGFFMFFIFMIIFITFFVLSTISIAIGWHRYMLLNETPPSFHIINRKWPIGSYFWNSIKIIILTFIMFIPIAFIMSTILPPIIKASSTSSLAGSFLLSHAIFLPINLLSFWLLLRIGLVLPAAAVGVKLDISESFKKTSGHNWQLLIVAFLLTLLYTLPSLIFLSFSDFSVLGNINPSQQFKTISFIISMIYTAFNWITFFIGFGILTVLYGHLFEDKAI